METKCLLHLDVVLKSMGLDYLSSTDEPEHPHFQTLLTEFVNLVHHECTSSVCHRITFLFGHLYRHDKLNAAWPSNSANVTSLLSATLHRSFVTDRRSSTTMATLKILSATVRQILRAI